MNTKKGKVIANEAISFLSLPKDGIATSLRSSQ